MTLMSCENQQNSHLQIYTNLPNYFKHQFLFDNHVRVLEISGPIYLALMVVVSDVFLLHLEDKAIQKTLIRNLSPLTYKRYVDDNKARFDGTSVVHKWYICPIVFSLF